MSLFAPRTAARALGVKAGEMTPAAITWAAVFASREAMLGALSLASERGDANGRRNVLYLNIAVDAADALSLLALARRHDQKRPLLVALPAAVASMAIHLQAVRQASAGAAPGARRRLP